MEKPLSVVIAALIKDNKILLINRARGDFVGLWALPGGKIEKNEHLEEAALREVMEEAGIESEFKNHLAVISEHLMENGEITNHFILNLCELTPKTTEIKNNPEEELGWFDLSRLEKIKEKIIPSDFQMIERIIKNREKNYFNCVIEKLGKSHTLRKFE